MSLGYCSSWCSMVLFMPFFPNQTKVPLAHEESSMTWVNILASSVWVSLLVVLLVTAAVISLVWNPTGFRGKKLDSIRKEFSGSDACCMPRLFKEVARQASFIRVGIVIMTNGLIYVASLMNSLSFEELLVFLVIEVVFVGVSIREFQKLLEDDLRYSRHALEVRKEDRILKRVA